MKNYNEDCGDEYGECGELVARREEARRAHAIEARIAESEAEEEAREFAASPLGQLYARARRYTKQYEQISGHVLAAMDPDGIPF